MNENIMTAPLSAEEMAEARRLLDATTEGPWSADLDMFNDDEGIVACVSNAENTLLATIGTDLVIEAGPNGSWTAEHEAKKNATWAQARRGQELRDATFIAASRTLVPRLLATVDDRDRAIEGLRAEVERLTSGRDNAVTSLQYIEDRDARVMRDLWDQIASLRAVAEQEPHAEEPTYAEALVDDLRCECCGQRISFAQPIGFFVEDDKREVVMHWGPCPEPDLWWNRDPCCLPKTFEAAYVRAKQDIDDGEARSVTLVRVRKQGEWHGYGTSAAPESTP